MLTVEIQRSFDASPAAVFEAWRDPKLLERWLWGSLARESRATVDFRPGGEFRVTTARPDGSTWALTGEYLEITPTRSLDCTLAWDAPMGYEPAPERLHVELVAQGDGAELHFRHSGIPTREAAKGHKDGWNNAFETLVRILNTRSPSAV